MTSQVKIQGSLKALMVAVTAVLLSMPAMEASAQRAPGVTGTRGTPTRPRPPVTGIPRRPVVVTPPCRRGGPGITPC